MALNCITSHCILHGHAVLISAKEEERKGQERREEESRGAERRGEQVSLKNGLNESVIIYELY